MRVDGQTYLGRRAADDRSPPQAHGRSGHRSHHGAARRSQRALPTASETCSVAGQGRAARRLSGRRRAGARWRTEIHSQHFACDRCGRSFEPLTPHSFSFNSSLGWCPACEGLGTQLGANPAALLRDPKLTLAEGAVALWPMVKRPLFEAMLAALAKHTGVPTRRAVRSADGSATSRSSCTGQATSGSTCCDQRETEDTDRPSVPLSVQRACIRRWKKRRGCRRRCAASWNIWSTKSSARPAAAAGCDDAAAVRLRDRTIDDIVPQCRWASCSSRFDRLEADRERRRKSPASWCAKCATACSFWSTWGWNI